MRPWVRAIGLLATALGLLATPAGAATKPTFEVHERHLQSILLTKGSNGFQALVETDGHRQVTMTLFKGSVSVQLRTTGRVNRRRIDATFGSLGRISVRFRSNPKAAERNVGHPGGRGGPGGDCRGRIPTIQAGVFHGTIRFRGENDFTRIDSEAAPGFVERRYRRVCKRDASKDSFTAIFEKLFAKARVTYLRTSARVDGANLSFEAASFDFSSIFGPGTPAETSFAARSVERSGGVRVVRSSTAEGGEGAFLTGKRGKAPVIATLAPPKPFTGTAKYVEEPGVPATWIGPLAVRLPGAGLAVLAGPGFTGVLCHLTFAELLEGRCAREPGRLESKSLAALARAAAQGSGSHSQAFWDARLSWSR